MIDQRNFTYMFYGFAAAWAIIVVYVVYLALREKKLRQELDRVRRMVESAAKSDRGSDVGTGVGGKRGAGR